MSTFDPRPFVPRLIHQRRVDDPRRWVVDGTLVMADVSGFTALSDQLARHGRLGAEELTATLNRIFTLILAASDDGGDVLKFGGDAILTLYTGPNHAARACHAARSMQRVLRAVGRVQLTGARTNLRMSVGIHSGAVELMLVGSSPVELFVLGPTVQRVLALEARASPGEVLVSSDTAATVEGNDFKEAGDGAHSLRGGRQLPPAAALFSQRDALQDVSPFLPPSLANRPDLMLGDGEHRRAAAGFIALGGLDGPIDGDRTELMERLDAAVGLIESASQELSITSLGSDVWPGGIKIMLAAGIPDAVEDPTADMLRCLTRIVQTDVGVSIKGGVATGPVFAGSLGALFRRTFTLMGDTVNLAARLASQARPGEVLTTRTVVEQSRFELQTGPPLVLQLKGKPIPVEALPVREVRSTLATGLGAGVPLVDRTVELSRLREVVTASATDGTLVEIHGEAGIGKSRLAAEALVDTAHHTLRCTRYDVDEPLLALRSILRDLLDIDRDTPASAAGERLKALVAEQAPRLVPWLPLLGVAIGADTEPTPEVDDLDPAFRRSRMQMTVGRLIRAVRPEGFVLLVEDAQWVDDSSADVLDALFADVRRSPWTVILTRRDDERGLRFPPQRATVMSLGSLDAGDAMRLAQSAARNDMHSHSLDQAVRRSGGNPLFVIELVRAGADPEHVPASMDALVASRIDDLDRAEREILRLAAVLGPRFHVALFSSVARFAGVSVPDLIDDLGVFIGREGDDYLFRRDVYREVAYAQLSYRRRREIHQWAGEELEAGVDGGLASPGVLARHFFEAHDWLRTWAHARAAADEAVARFANEEAIQFFAWATEAGRRAGLPADEVGAVHEALGDAAERAARFDVAGRAYQTARSLRHDPLDHARLLERSGQLHERNGRYPTALATYARARSRLPTSGPVPSEAVELGARIDLAAAGVRYRQGRWTDCMRLCDAAAEAAEASGARQRLAHAQYLYDTALVEVEGPSAIRYGESPLHIFEELNDLLGQAKVLNNLGVQAYFRGEWRVSTTYYERARVASDRAGDIIGTGTTVNNLGETRSDQGAYEAAHHDFTQAHRIFTAAGYPIGAALVTSNLGRLARRRGALDEAGDLLDQAVDAFTAVGAGAFVAETDARRLELALARGDPRGVVGRCDGLLLVPALAGATTPLHALLHRIAGLAAWAAGDRAVAKERLAASLLLARSIGAGFEEALTCVALAEVGVDPALHRATAADLLEPMAVTAIDLPSLPVEHPAAGAMVRGLTPSG